MVDTKRTKLGWEWFLETHKDLNAVPYPEATRLSYWTNTFFLDERTRKFDKLDTRKKYEGRNFGWFYHDIEPNRTYEDLMIEIELMFQSIHDWQHNAVTSLDYDEDSKTIEICISS